MDWYEDQLDGVQYYQINADDQEDSLENNKKIIAESNNVETK